MIILIWELKEVLTKVTTYAKGGNPEVLNYAYMGGPTEVLLCYGMLSPEMVQLFGQNDERLNQFFKTSDNSIYYFDEGSGAALWNTSITYSKFQPMSVGMRTAEVYDSGRSESTAERYTGSCPNIESVA